MLKALCVIGVKDYNSALKMILSSLDLVKDCKAKSRTGGDTSLPPSIPGPGPGPVPGMEGLESYQSREFTPHTGIPEQSSAGCSVQGEAHRGNTSLSPTDFTLLMRCEWILSYHSALCSYHTGRYAKALQVRLRSNCID